MANLLPLPLFQFSCTGGLCLVFIPSAAAYTSDSSRSEFLKHQNSSVDYAPFSADHVTFRQSGV